MGADRGARVGAVRNGTPGAMPASGKRRNAPGAPVKCVNISYLWY